MKQKVHDLIQWMVVSLLWVGPAVSSAMTSIRAQCSGTATLPCTATREESYTYRAVSWYKVVNQTQDTGIIRKTERSVRLYSGFTGAVSLDGRDSLTIAHVSEEDAGIYRCTLFASVGGSNQNGQVSLQVSVCLPPDASTSAAAASLGRSSSAAQLTSATQLLSPPAHCLCVPSAVLIIGCLSFLAVLNVVKGLACYCSIQVFRRVRRPKQESTPAAVDVEERMVQSLREHMQRFSVEKHQRDSRVRAHRNVSFHSVYTQ